MRKISADLIFTGHEFVSGISLCVNEEGRIDGFLYGAPPETTEFHKGILVPGFVNAHCHLELSYLKGKIPPKEGLDSFIGNIQKLRTHKPSDLEEILKREDQNMWKEGIVAVGDIVNDISSLKVKTETSKIYYHSFIEVFAFLPARAHQAFQQGVNIYGRFLQHYPNTQVSVTPHAPYSASSDLLRLIAAFAKEHASILSMHNQENEDENVLFQEGKGPVLDRLKEFGIDTSFWMPTGKSALKSTIGHLPEENKILLVHNTVSTPDDINYAQSVSKNLYWCLCPNANLYIEDRLPDYNLFKDLRVTIGTDSLASNDSLSILAELKVINKAAPFIPLEKLIRWATYNGAEFLGIQHKFGSFIKGEKPGVNLIGNLDMENLRLKSESSVERLA